ncbi:MAG: hypothetical protein O7H39_13025 [Gammaproteobacteria bacterium]|nr:hypothetical protein [Gammaproteobacteria bacterium]
MDAETPDAQHPHRLMLLWKLTVFMGKLMADGLRDVILMPISVAAVVAGMVLGGDKPDRYFRQLMQLGRRTDVWINLFGTYRRGATSDKLVKPVEERILQEYGRGGWLSKAEKGMSKMARSSPQDDDTG